MHNDDRNIQGTAPKRVAIYARYSSDLQRPSSIVDQVRQCKDAAVRNGWVVVDDYIRADEAVSGQSRVGRHGLDDLVRLAEQKPSPFDGIIIDDTSRFGRNLSDTLPLSEILENANVFLYFANCNLDSRDPNFRLLFIAYGQQDEQASRRLAERVHRGQRGRVLNGYVGSGRVYGFTNVPVEDPTRKGLYGRPFVEAVKLEVNPEEAAVVIRIFQMYAGGLGCRAIAMRLNADGVPSPLKGQGRGRRLWSTFAISGILTNEKYRGMHIWNRTKVVRNPRTHRTEQRPRPQSEWERVEVPEWRIVSEELWTAAVEVKARRQNNWLKVGGLNRTAASLDYIFSGVMVCGECGGPFNVIGGKGQGARYGCAGHRFNGACGNSLTILRRVLEERMVHALSLNLRTDELRQLIESEFHAQIAKVWKDRSSKGPRASSGAVNLRKRRDKLRQQGENLVEAIAATKGSTLLYERLGSIEAQIRNVGELLSCLKERRTAVPSMLELQAFVERKLAELESLIQHNPQVAKQLILKRVGKLVMAPMYPSGEPSYEVRGDVGLFAGSDRRKVHSRVKSSSPGLSIAASVAA